MAGGIAPVNFWDVLMASEERSRQARAQRQQLAMERERMDAAKQAQDLENSRARAGAAREDMLREATAAAYAGQPGQMMAMFPQQYGEFQKTQGELQKTQREIAAQDKTAADARALSEAQAKETAAKALAANPGLAPRIQAALRRQGFNIQLPGFALPEGMAGPQMAPTKDEIAGLRTEARMTPGFSAKETERKTTGDMLEAASRLGYHDDVAAAEQDPKWDAMMSKVGAGKATQLNIGGKDLPAEKVAEFGDVEFLRKGLRGLGGSFASSVGAAGVLGQAKSRLLENVPNTDVSNYNLQADAFAQKLGTTLEGGKLTDNDYQVKYRKMVPRPGDSPETARKKIENIDALLAGYSEARQSAYARSGYKTPAPKQGEAAQPPKESPVAGMTVAQLKEDLRRRLESKTINQATYDAAIRALPGD